MLKTRTTVLLAVVPLAALALVACDKETTPAPLPSSSTGAAASAQSTTNSATTATAPAATAAAEATAPKKAVAFAKAVGLDTPESVLYDDQADAYLVSNINGQPLAMDGNGFVSQLSPDGTVKTLKWIEGGKNKVTLNAPKGLALTADTLWVADVDTVRLFDRKTGAPKGEVKVPGATFLNDMAASPDGKTVYVSDSGFKAGAKGFDPTGTDAVYAIDAAKKLTTIAKSKDLGGPNGLLPSADGAKLWVATFGSGELYSLDAKNTKGDAKKADVTKLPKGSLDGIVALPGGDLLVSSWEGSSVYRGKPGSDFKVVLENVKAPADIGYDTKRGRVLVPLFQDSGVEVYDLK